MSRKDQHSTPEQDAIVNSQRGVEKINTGFCVSSSQAGDVPVSGSAFQVTDSVPQENEIEGAHLQPLLSTSFQSRFLNIGRDHTGILHSQEMEKFLEIGQTLRSEILKVDREKQHPETHLPMSSTISAGTEQERNWLETSGPDEELCSQCEQPRSHDNILRCNRCRERYCFICINEYVRTDVATARVPVRLFCYICSARFDVADILPALNLNSSFYGRAIDILYAGAFFKELRFCGNQQCRSPFDWLKDETVPCGVDEKNMVTCPICLTQTCAYCNCLWHLGERCEEYRNRMYGESNQSPQDALEPEEGKNCPQCHETFEHRPFVGVDCICASSLCSKCGMDMCSCHIPAAVGEISLANVGLRRTRARPLIDNAAELVGEENEAASRSIRRNILKSFTFLRRRVRGRRDGNRNSERRQSAGPPDF